MYSQSLRPGLLKADRSMRGVIWDIISNGSDGSSPIKIEQGNDALQISEGSFNISWLKSEHPLFQQIDWSIIKELMFEADISILKEGEYLYARGNTAKEFYIILYGRMLLMDNRTNDTY